ncbi:MAG: hypothetical protein LBD63_03565 [Mycoplasmataceae bacterium]|jgi:hypothetical protein|nr:hypothetical protein [Mycoplasmataceae bacterium]
MDRNVIKKIVKRKQTNLIVIIFHRAIALDKIINSEPSSRLSRKIVTAKIAQIIAIINTEKLCKSKTALFHKEVGANLTTRGVKTNMRNKYNQYKPADIQMAFRLKTLRCR